MQSIRSLDELTALVEQNQGEPLYVRWSPDIGRDVRTGTSRDELTGVELPGLSVNSLQVEPWWDGRPLRAWLARRLYDYRHLERRRGRTPARGWLPASSAAAGRTTSRCSASAPSLPRWGRRS